VRDYDSDPDIRHPRYRDWGEEDESEHPPVKTKPALTGLISFALAILLGPAVLLLFLVAGMIEASSPGTMADDSPGAIAAGLVLLACLGGMLAGAILGFVALGGQGSLKVFALLGAILNTIGLVGSIGLIVVGLLMG
jgi:hypothetical protein